MAKFLDTTVQGNITVNGNITIGESEIAILDIINRNYNNLYQLFAKDCILSHSVAAAANYTVTDTSVYLIGNIVRLAGRTTRSSAPTGNITDEEVMTLTINHEGRLKALYNIGFASQGTGSISEWYTASATKIDDNTMSLIIKFAGTHSANTSKEFTFFAHIPVVLNTEYFDSNEAE